MEGTLVKIRADVVTEGALVITCFPSVGMVSSVVGHYLIDNLDLEFVGGVVDPRLPPLTLVTDGKPMPIIRAYAGKPECSIEGCDKIILLMSELVIPSPLVHETQELRNQPSTMKTLKEPIWLVLEQRTTFVRC